MKKIIITKDAPQPIGPYNQATLFNGMLFISGQIALNPETGELVMDSIENETHQVLKNLGAILKEAGYSYDDVLKCSVFVTDMHMFSRINAIYSQYFKEENAPARELVQVAALPRFVNVEISVIAAK
ncbi:MAG: RidA family protein [Saprospiraceae bacterium]|nr:RidA family protein [Saprospiraceae bacterium]